MSVAACAGLDETGLTSTVPIHSRSRLIVKSMLVHVFVNNVPVVALIDPGSDVNLMSAGLMANHRHWRSVPTDIRLNFANASKGVARHASGYECQC